MESALTLHAPLLLLLGCFVFVFHHSQMNIHAIVKSRSAHHMYSLQQGHQTSKRGPHGAVSVRVTTSAGTLMRGMLRSVAGHPGVLEERQVGEAVAT